MLIEALSGEALRLFYVEVSRITQVALHDIDRRQRIARRTDGED
jgi:hypothetical protein